MKSCKSIEIISISSTQPVNTELLAGQKLPVLIRGCDVGKCLSKWTPEYLEAKGQNKHVKVHRSSKPKLDFRAKNFTYETVSFTELVRNCSLDTDKDGTEGQEKTYWYLRSLGEDPRYADYEIEKEAYRFHLVFATNYY